jgi:ABC-type transport system involved in multi-copper enzyme maturation permease subunit
MLSILTGKLLATFINVLVQLLFLMVALTLVNTLIQGRFEFIWGNNPLMVLLITVASAIGATGIGAITAAAARNSEQAATFGSIIAIFSAVLGGAFGFQLGGGLQNLSIVYWGSNAYTLLANNNTDVWLNALVLTVFGAVTFAIGFIIFARRLRD